MKKKKAKQKKTLRELTPAQAAKELSPTQKTYLRHLCEGWHGPDRHDDRTMVALHRRGLVTLRFVDQNLGTPKKLSGDLVGRRYRWDPTHKGQRVFERIKLSRGPLPVNWAKEPVQPKGKKFVRRRNPSTRRVRSFSYK